jgi:signal transduction histidine kinase
MTVADPGLAMIAHELRAPLTTLRLLTEDLIETGQLPAPVVGGDAQIPAAQPLQLAGPREERTARHWVHDVQRLHNIITQMACTLDNLVDAAAATQFAGAASDWRRLDIAECCHRAADLVRPQLSSRTTLEVATGSGAPLRSADLGVMGNADAICRLLVNLLTNACRHTPAGRISLSARITPTSPATPTSPTKRRGGGGRGGLRGGGWVTLEVSDTGCGIDPAMLPRLGEPFAIKALQHPQPPQERLAAGGAGVRGCGGLGLWICRRIAAAHGGNLCLATRRPHAPHEGGREGLGSTFIARLRTDLAAPRRVRVLPPIRLLSQTPGSWEQAA